MKDEAHTRNFTRGRHRFAPTALFIAGGLLIWMLDFAFVYVFGALACARGFAHLHVGPVAIVPFVTTTASVLAAIGSVLLLSRAARQLRTNTDEQERFIAFVALATTVIALVALIWLALPPWLMGGCERPSS